MRLFPGRRSRWSAASSQICAPMGRPSKHGRRNTRSAREEDDLDEERVIEEVGSDENDETDSQAGGLVLARRKSTKQVSSDSLQFTGLDKGRRSGRPRRGYEYHSDDEDNDNDTSGDSEDSEEDLRTREEALVQSAMARIRRARSKGKQEVKLSKDEVKALDRRRTRIEASRNNRRSQRVAIPLSQLDASAYMMNASLPEESIPQNLLQQLPPSATQQCPGEQQGYLPMGYFPSAQPPLKGPRPRQRSASTTSQIPSHRGSSPFQFSYVHPQQHLQRQGSEVSRPASRARSRPASMIGPPAGDENWSPTSSQPSNTSSIRPIDIFQFQTGGSRTNPGYTVAQGGPTSVASRRHSSNPLDLGAAAAYFPGQGLPVVLPRDPPARDQEKETSGEETDDGNDDESEGEDEKTLPSQRSSVHFGDVKNGPDKAVSVSDGEELPERQPASHPKSLGRKRRRRA